MPRVDLPDVILEAMSWEPSFTAAFTSITGGRARALVRNAWPTAKEGSPYHGGAAKLSPEPAMGLGWGPIPAGQGRSAGDRRQVTNSGLSAVFIAARSTSGTGRGSSARCQDGPSAREFVMIATSYGTGTGGGSGPKTTVSGQP